MPEPSRRDRDRDLFAALKGQVSDLLADSTPEAHAQTFLSCNITNEHRSRFVEHTMARFERKLFQSDDPVSLVPRIIHRVWLTHPDTPQNPLPNYVTRVRNNASRIGEGYEVIVWHNSDTVAEHLRAEIPNDNVRFRNVFSTESEPEVLERIQAAIEARKFVMAGDMTKYLVLREFGGVYADLGIDFTRPFLDLASQADMTLFLDRNMFFQPAFMMARANDHAFVAWCRVLAEPEIISSIALRKHAAFSPGDEIHMHGGVGFTAALLLLFDDSFDLLSVPPNRGLLHHESEGSWYRPGNKFGNATLATASITHLSEAKHRAYVERNEALRAALPFLAPVAMTRISLEAGTQDRFWLR